MTTWHDFPDFYNNEFIKTIATNPRWTVSDKDKVPIDMHALMHEKKIWGMSLKRDYNPLVTLDVLNDFLPNAANNAYYLDALEDKFVVLDIEPKCPEIVKESMTKLPYVYGEVSMSGKGYHLVFPLPELINNYPNAMTKLALKHELGYFEILLNHMVTFTRKVLPPCNPEYKMEDFEHIFELLAEQAKETKTSTSTITSIDDINTDNIPNFQSIVHTLENQTYGKTINDFGDDYSRYEFGICGFYMAILKRMLPDRKFKDHEYTDEEMAIIVYSVVSEKLPYRDKHDSIRNNMPWLLYLSSKVVKD